MPSTAGALSPSTILLAPLTPYNHLWPALTVY
jgi:hypothetical protein